MWNTVLPPALEDTKYTSILFCSIFTTLHDRSGGWNVWQWGWEEHEWRRETTLRSGQNCQPLGPQGSRARQCDSWPMGYLTEGRRSNSHMKILLMKLPAAMHQVVLSKSCTKNIGGISLELEFSEMHFNVWLKVSKKLKRNLWIFKLLGEKW